MPGNLRLAYFAHTLRSDWNNGNAHFLRGLMRAMGSLGHQVTVFEPETGWSIDNLRQEALGEASLAQFVATYSDINVETYSDEEPEYLWLDRLDSVQVAILHEWNPPALAEMLLRLRDRLGFRLLFHDTHHRASSSPEQMESLRIRSFDGVIAFGESLRRIYEEAFGIENVWILHEAADTTVFHPAALRQRRPQVVWIGNWGDGERSCEIANYLLKPAAELAHLARFCVYGVRYPDEGLAALRSAGVAYAGYLPNLQAPQVYSQGSLTVHIPRQQYNLAMTGIPTIRVFEALACGIPLISAPWQDTEQLFRDGDLFMAHNPFEMTQGIAALLQEPRRAEDQAQRGLETVLSRHTCIHRAHELTAICQELLA